jgi:hypothetical protein
MKRQIIFLISLLCVAFLIPLIVQAVPYYASDENEIQKLENPVTVEYLSKNLRKESPRLVLTPLIEQGLKQKIKSDPLVRNYFEAMKINAAEIQTKPLLVRKLDGRRLLGVSREMLYRMNVLSMVYRIEKDPKVLQRIDTELSAVCSFTDWNPSHFLDVAEMSLAVAIAVDWVGEALPKGTSELAKTSLIEKGIKPSFAGQKDPGWVSGTNNWNQVCNGGMIAAAIVIAGKDPDLAARTISRSLNGMPFALKQYAPDGVYPEGATYWDYGTSFSVITSSMLESAFGTDFGITTYPAFLKSADFRMLCVAPSGWYFNFADCGDKTGNSGDIVLAWFAKATGNPLYLDKEKFLKPPPSFGKLSRLAGAGLVWLSQFVPKDQTSLPMVWKGEGENPVVIFRGGIDDQSNYYFGGKGGKASLSHGNMDAGSFVFELNNVRWVIDPGVQDYNTLEQAGFDLWGMCQTCQRWSLLTKGNQGHSTLSVNNARFNVTGSAPLINFKSGSVPEATFDMTQIFKGHLKSAGRKFQKEGNHSVIIEDMIVVSDSTKFITWAIMTTADVVPTTNGATLRKEGKQLNMEILSPTGQKVSILNMDPPPLKLDRKIENLKRVEIRIPANSLSESNGIIKVRLSGPE